MQISAFIWTLVGLAMITLAIVIWHRDARPAVRAVLCLMASSGLSFVLSNSGLTLILFSISGIMVTITWWLAQHSSPNKTMLLIWILILIFGLIISRLPQTMSAFGPGLWIGVSYLIFRLIHICIDSQRGKLVELSLPETIIYALHPATLVAGPIDRIQHSLSEQRAGPSLPSSYLNEGIWRLFFGLVKKIALANACFALMSAFDATQITPSRAAAWIWVFAYSFYIYFDFAGYCDMAIGVGLLMGMRLPENFANPYMSSSITHFWQAWHITLSTWLRDYIFFPMSRTLLRRFGSRFSSVILLVSHLTTMVICGLWHGLRLELAAWGLWHGLGLFAHNRWQGWQHKLNLPKIPAFMAIVMTYMFVTLGWVFFSMRFTHALSILARLFGFR